MPLGAIDLPPVWFRVGGGKILFYHLTYTPLPPPNSPACLLCLLVNFCYIMQQTPWSKVKLAVKAWSPFSVQFKKKCYPWVQLAGHEGKKIVLQLVQYFGEGQRVRLGPPNPP